jgi:hypothetical protein
MPADLTRMRHDLQELLQESDLGRPLDSLETVVVISYLTERDIPATAAGFVSPHTIEGWLAWVAQRSADS